MTISKFKVKQIQHKVRTQLRWDYCMSKALAAGFTHPNGHSRSIYEEVIGLEKTIHSPSGRKQTLSAVQLGALEKVREIYTMLDNLEELMTFVHELPGVSQEDKLHLEELVRQIDKAIITKGMAPS